MKIIKWGVLIIVAVMIIAPGGIYLYIRSTLPDYDGEVHISGINEKIEILRDRYGIPHIFAGSQNDLAFGLGYAMAQDRLWQMDIFKRVALGRLSEILGEMTMAADEYARVFGFARNALSLVSTLTPEESAYLKAFVNGINTYIETQNEVPLEFRILGYQPEAFTMKDILALSIFQAYASNHNWKFEILRAAAIAELGPKKGRELLPALTFNGPYMALPGFRKPNEGTLQKIAPMVPVDSGALKIHPDLVASLLEADQIFTSFSGHHGNQIHSNFWVVSGKRSSSGKPIMANDYHMPFLLPSLWYEVHLQGDGIDAMGISLPGYPAIIAGHNRHIAWGATTTGADTQDIYIEKLNPDNNDEYLFKGQYYPFKIIKERIYYKSKEGRMHKDITVKISRHGPIVNAIATNLNKDHPPLAFKKIEGDTEGQMAFCMNLMKASNWKEFKKALSYFKTPVWNWGYVDKDGNIGMRVNGHIPIRQNGDGMEPVPGWTGEYEWAGVIPVDELPEAYNPDTGYIVSANNELRDSDYPYSIMGSAFVLPYRAMRIEALIQEKGPATYDTMKDIQKDTHSIFGLKMARHILDATDNMSPDNKRPDYKRPDYKRIDDFRNRLKNWDGSTGVDSVANTIAQEFTISLMRNVFENKMSNALYKQFLDSGNMNYVSAVLLFMLQDDSSHGWFDDPSTEKKETRDQTIIKSLLETDTSLTDHLGDDIDGWKWGKIHRLTFTHALGTIPPFKWIWNLGMNEFGGDISTVNPGTHTNISQKPYQVTHGASMRHVIDFGDFDNAGLVITTGQSGRWSSPHYGDQARMWRDFEYIPMVMDREKIELQATSKLTFLPVE